MASQATVTDKVSDAANCEQVVVHVNVFIHWVDENFQSFEEFVCLHLTEFMYM